MAHPYEEGKQDHYQDDKDEDECHHNVDHLIGGICLDSGCWSGIGCDRTAPRANFTDYIGIPNSYCDLLW